MLIPSVTSMSWYFWECFLCNLGKKEVWNDIPWLILLITWEAKACIYIFIWLVAEMLLYVVFVGFVFLFVLILDHIFGLVMGNKCFSLGCTDLVHENVQHHSPNASFPALECWEHAVKAENSGLGKARKAVWKHPPFCKDSWWEAVLVLLMGRNNEVLRFPF